MNFQRFSGFTLIEVLLAILLSAVAIVPMVSGFGVSDELSASSEFEVFAALYAERELEMLKCDLESGKRKFKTFTSPGRFLLSQPWKSSIFCLADFKESVARIACEVRKDKKRIILESFFYVPK
ncbi:MAG: prepilin-type N-terminal cleavage/methylation domain-containing protein [Candidatus Riflebacteria bacterium]|nr:prepilin-type N-terminal cleavage/methylation domain-containing protein [Candidatus Riflebacteria bacterium]